MLPQTYKIDRQLRPLNNRNVRFSASDLDQDMLLILAARGLTYRRSNHMRNQIRPDQPNVQDYFFQTWLINLIK